MRESAEFEPPIAAKISGDGLANMDPGRYKTFVRTLSGMGIEIEPIDEGANPESVDPGEGVSLSDYKANWNYQGASKCWNTIVKYAREMDDFPLTINPDDSTQLSGNIIEAKKWLDENRPYISSTFILQRIIQERGIAADDEDSSS